MRWCMTLTLAAAFTLVACSDDAAPPHDTAGDVVEADIDVAAEVEVDDHDSAAPPPTPPEGFTYLPAGSFTMGSPRDEEGRDDDEVQRQATITRGFFLKITEVTQAEWEDVMGTEPARHAACGADCPVERVSWYDALVYVNTLSEREGLAPCYTLSICRETPGAGCGPDLGTCADGFVCELVEFEGLACEGYRLPTEAEWEYAARAGSPEARHGALDDVAWHADNADGAPHPVASKDPNAWGLYDMLGNVWEWAHDGYAPYLGPATDPIGTESRHARVNRGGSWADHPRHARAARRNSMPPGVRDQRLGLRPARTAP